MGFTGEDVVVRPLLPSTRHIERNHFPAPTEADLLPPAGGGRESSEASENDSSVANNVSDDVLAPRSNLLSLLDLDYRASGGGSTGRPHQGGGVPGGISTKDAGVPPVLWGGHRSNPPKSDSSRFQSDDQELLGLECRSGLGGQL